VSGVSGRVEYSIESSIELTPALIHASLASGFYEPLALAFLFLRR
jgi:hypothetical protein